MRPIGPRVRVRSVRRQPSAHLAGPPATARSRLLGWARCVAHRDEEERKNERALV